MTVQYEPSPFGGKTSLVPFKALRREPDFTSARTLHPPRLSASGGETRDVEALWRAIEAVPAPPANAPPPTFYSTKASPSAAAAAIMVAIWRRRLLAGGLSIGAGVGMALEPAASIAWAAAAVGGAYLAASLPKRAAEVAQAARQIERQFAEGLRRWRDQCSSVGFLEARAKLEAAHADLVLLDVEERRRIEIYTQDRRAAQLKHALQRSEIGRDKIRGVGPRRLERLISHGVESAHDVVASRVSRVPGIGPVTTEALLSWRTRIESEFVCELKTSRQDRARIAMIEDDIAERGAQLRAQLQDGPQRLERLRASIEARRRHVDPQLDELHDRWLRAGADLKICGQRLAPLPTSPTSVASRESHPLRRPAIGMMRPEFA